MSNRCKLSLSIECIDCMVLLVNSHAICAGTHLSKWLLLRIFSFRVKPNIESKMHKNENVERIFLWHCFIYSQYWQRSPYYILCVLKTKQQRLLFYPSVNTFRFWKWKEITENTHKWKRYSAKKYLWRDQLKCIHGCWNSEACEFDLAWNSVIYHSLECFGFNTTIRLCYSIQMERLECIIWRACVVYFYRLNEIFIATFGQAIFHRSAS